MYVKNCHFCQNVCQKFLTIVETSKRKGQKHRFLFEGAASETKQKIYEAFKCSLTSSMTGEIRGVLGSGTAAIPGLEDLQIGLRIFSCVNFRTRVKLDDCDASCLELEVQLDSSFRALLEQLEENIIKLKTHTMCLIFPVI